MVDLAKIQKKAPKPKKIAMKFSPIIERYIRQRNYQTKNYLKSNLIKLSEYDDSQELYERKFATYQVHINKAAALAEEFGDLIREKKLYTDLNRKINRIK